MNRRMTGCIGIVFAVAGPCMAQYALTASVFGAGGSPISGGSYAVNCTVGQSSPVGISTGAAFETRHGFWHAPGGGGPLSPMVLMITLLNPTTAKLAWATVTGATMYDLYRSTTPFFNPSGVPWQAVAAPDVSWEFGEGIGNTAVNYYFRGIARNGSQSSPPSNTVGEFEFGTGGSLLKPAGAEATD